jgi:protein phosphatase
MDFGEIVSQSQSASAEEFLAVVDDAMAVLSRPELNFAVLSGKLAILPPVGEAIVVGDLHGDLNSLSTIIAKSGFLDSVQAGKAVKLVFLGDYVDRGLQSPEVYFSVMRLKLAFPKQVILLRGNHEGPVDLPPSPHDLPLFLQQRFGGKWAAVYQKIRQSFNSLYTAAYVEMRCLMVHGGLPAQLSNLQNIAQAQNVHPTKPFLEELLWNDPDDTVNGVLASPRGAGNLFGKTVTAAVLGRLNVKILIRGHEQAPNGYKLNHDGKVLTLFSRKGSPYFNRFGAFLQMPLAETYETANQLVPYIRRF